MAAIGGVAAASVVAGAILLVTAGNSPNPKQLANGSATTTTADGTLSEVSVPKAALSDEASLVELRVTTPSGTTNDCGVAVSAGGMVATTAAAVQGSTNIRAVTMSGQNVSAKVMATDKDSDIALLQIAIPLPVPQFIDDVGLAAGRPIMMMQIGQSPTNHTVPQFWPGSVAAAATAVQTGAARGMASIVSSTTNAPTEAGAVLLDSAGSVAGIYDPTGTANGLGRVFLPTELLIGVTGDLASSGKVDHGWIGLRGEDAPNGAGAQVVSVSDPGPSANILRSGDVITSVNGDPVRSMAELRSRLYVLDPDTKVQLTVVQNNAVHSADVTLSSSS
jgi:S1-C subfamily serine protease